MHAALAARLDAALAARQRLRDRPPRATAEAPAAAARRWRDDPELAADLPGVTGLSAEMVAAVLPLAAEPITVDAMLELLDREGPRGPADRPALIAHVLASNVPALALPAIVLGCLAGAAVVVKSGRDDPLSAPAFARALDALDPDLASTVVATYWSGGDRALEGLVLSRAQVVVASGEDRTIAGLRSRTRAPIVGHGSRWSFAAIARDDPADAEALALDVALYDQRGCLSPHAAYVAGDARGFAARLGHALGAVAARLPPGTTAVGERAADRAARDEAEWQGTEVHRTLGGTVLYDERGRFRPTGGRRTIRVHPIATLADAQARGRLECVGVAGPPPDLALLEQLGVSRVCPLGRMQRPGLAWPRGQMAALGSLLGRPGRPHLAVER